MDIKEDIRLNGRVMVQGLERIRQKEGGKVKQGSGKKRAGVGKSGGGEERKNVDEE